MRIDVRHASPRLVLALLVLLTGCSSERAKNNAVPEQPEGGSDSASFDAAFVDASDATVDAQTDAQESGVSDGGASDGSVAAANCKNDSPTIPPEFADHSKQTFCDHFDTFDIQDAKHAPDGTWATTFHWGSPDPSQAEDGDRVLFQNPEDEWYVSEFYSPAGVAPVNPFKIVDDMGRRVLRIRAEPAPPAMLPHMQGRNYTSGMISTHASFSHRYGFGVIRCRLPGPVGQERGAWPSAWWLRPNGDWPPEFDLLDNALGAKAWVTAAPADVDIQYDTLGDNGNPGVDFSAGYHEFGFGWTATEISWWLDGKKIRSAPTPATYHSPMFFLFTFAIGASGAWDGNAEVKPSTKFPLDAHIDAVWIYEK